MAKHKIFFILALCFLVGVFLASFFQIEHYHVLVLFAAGTAFLAINYQGGKAAVLGVGLLFLAFGILRMNAALADAKEELSSQKLGAQEFTAVVSGEPEVDELFQKVIVKNGEGEKILLNLDAFPSFSYGDELKINCELEKPTNLEGSRFDYQMYLAKEGIYRVCKKTHVAVVAQNRGNKSYSVLLAVKYKFEEKISRIFPDPEGAYLKGLLLGGSKRMTKKLSDAFSRTGTTHAVAVSGYNVAIVAAFLMEAGILLGLWRQQVFSFAVIGIIFFVLMTGAPSSAVRAGIMGGLLIWAIKEGRLANSENAILLAACTMLLANPLLLRYDAGFQLSFLATLGIVYLSPLFEKIFWKGRPPKLIQETVLLTMAALVFVMPVILNSFEKLSLVSPLANFLILPAIPMIMGLGFAAGIAGFVFLPLGKLVGFLPYILLKSELFIVQWLGNLPWASIEIKNFGWQHVAIYYLVLCSLIYFAKRKRRSRPAVEAMKEI